MGSRVSFHFKKPEPSVCSNASHLLVSLKTVGSPGSVLPFHPQPLKCIKKTFLVSTEEVRRAFLYGSEYLGTEMTQGQSLGLALDWGPLCPMQGPNWTAQESRRMEPCIGCDQGSRSRNQAVLAPVGPPDQLQFPLCTA